MKAPPREDIFVSVCCTAEIIDAPDVDELGRLSLLLSERFRYWEILVAVPADAMWNADILLSKVSNLRLVSIRSGTPFYRSRVAIASEAIGDVVLLTVPDELSTFDPLFMMEEAYSRNVIIIGRREQHGIVNPALVALGRSAGFRVDDRDMLTTAYPRTLLNRILAHPNRQLALRFPPVDNALSVEWLTRPGNGKRARPFQEVGRRLGLIQKLVVSSAPRVLALVSLLSLLVMIGATAFAFYAVTVWLTLESVQPGWFTTSLALSLTAAFLACAIFGLAIGLQKIIEALTEDASDYIVGEQSAVDMFGQVFHQLNVDVESWVPPATATHPPLESNDVAVGRDK
ncbi:hypothetical protein [Rhizobium sp. LCM 4573]|uniref:hypothetical protein n=1 Tax=Rhizobium sp. LCM 4573 TaxID=1848291 RepID=UPI0008D9CE24|nr:hypothetical protein [Rhizobium sp. LCM 4573]OHV77113.1 hypothetical protein LCM4573_10105 [Rhizobium sp. LCM 4573]